MANEQKKRKLPIIQPSDDTGDDERPPWQWAAIGGVAILVAWLPLSMLGNVVSREVWARLLPSGDNPEAVAQAYQALSGADRLGLGLGMVIPHLVALALAAFLGGLMVGRFGGSAGKKEATAAGVVVALVAAFSAAPPDAMAAILALAVMAVLAALSARAGAAAGQRMRATKG